MNKPLNKPLEERVERLPVERQPIVSLRRTYAAGIVSSALYVLSAVMPGCGGEQDPLFDQCCDVISCGSGDRCVEDNDSKYATCIDNEGKQTGTNYGAMCCQCKPVPDKP